MLDPGNLPDITGGPAEGPLVGVAPSGEIVSWDSRAESLLGYEADEVIGRSFVELIADDEERERARQALARTIQDGELWTRLKLRTADGETVELDTQQTTVRHASRHPAIVILRARKVSKASPVAPFLATDERQNALMAAADHLALGFVVTVANPSDPSKGPVFAFVNAAAAEMLGRAPEDLVGTPALAVVPDEAREHLQELMQRADAGEAVHMVTTNIQHADGSEVPVEAGVGTGTLNGQQASYAFLRDLTKQEERYQRMETMRTQVRQLERLSALQATVTQLGREARASVADVVRELRRLRGLIEGAEGLPVRADELQGRLEAAWQAGLQALWRVDAMEDTAEAELRTSQGWDPKAPAAPLDELLEPMLPELDREIGEARLVMRLSPTEPVDIDPLALKQIVKELLENAAQSAPGRRRVKLSTSMDSQHAILLIEDDGDGIEPHVLEMVKEPFFTTGEDRLGLGLTVVDDILQGLGGSLGLESQPGQGTRVRVALPTAAAARARDLEPPELTIL